MDSNHRPPPRQSGKAVLSGMSWDAVLRLRTACPCPRKFAEERERFPYFFRTPNRPWPPRSTPCRRATDSSRAASRNGIECASAAIWAFARWSAQGTATGSLEPCRKVRGIRNTRLLVHCLNCLITSASTRRKGLRKRGSSILVAAVRLVPRPLRMPVLGMRATCDPPKESGPPMMPKHGSRTTC